MTKPITITRDGEETHYELGSARVTIEDGDFELTNLGFGGDGLRDLAAVLAHPDLQKLMHPAGSPEAARAAVVAALDNPNRMPTAAETFALITEDRVSGWLWWRAVEWAKLRIEQGYDVGKSETSVKHAQRFDRHLVKTIKALDESKPMGGALGAWFMYVTGWEKRHKAA